MDGHADDTMLNMKDVVRMTGLSESTVERRIADGLFPEPTPISKRRIGWPARKVKAWLEEQDARRGRRPFSSATPPLGANSRAPIGQTPRPVPPLPALV